MRLSRSSIQAVAAAAALVSARSAASAAIISYDLRWAEGQGAYDNGHSLYPNFGSHALDLWVRVRGTDGNHANESHTFDYITIMSLPGSPQALGPGSGLLGAQLAPGFGEAGSHLGSGSELNGDGVIDWGATVTAFANTNYMLVRTAVLGGRLGGGTVGQSVDANTWEFKIASFSVVINSLGPGEWTEFDVVQPNSKAIAGTLSYSGSTVDGATFNVTSSNTQGAYTASQGAILLYPEPGAGGLLGALAVGLLGRRRKRAAI